MDTEVNKDSIIARIKKLMSLANDRGATESEAIQAALKAQKLLSEYDITEAELHKGEKPEIAQISTGVVTKRNFERWLASIVAKNFRCHSYTKSKYGVTYSGRSKLLGREVYFYGYASDAEAAKITYGMLNKVGNRLAHKAAREQMEIYGTAAGAYNSFARGFLAGVQQELEKQSQALMLLIPREVDEAYKEESASWKSMSYSLRGGYDRDYYERGERAGRDAVRSRRIEQGGKKALQSPSEVREAAKAEAAAQNSTSKESGRHQ